MVSKMANPHYGDLELVRGKESTIWATNLTKELRNNKKLASTYLLEPQTSRKSSWKPLPLFFPFFDLGEHIPRANNGGSGGGRMTHIFIYFFSGRWADEPPLQMILLGAAHPLSRPWKWGHFQGRMGVTRPFSRAAEGAATPTDAIFRGRPFLQYPHSIYRNGWLFGPPLKKRGVVTNHFCSSDNCK